RVEAGVPVHCRRQDVRRHARDHQRAAIRRRARDRLGTDQAAAAGAVLDEELLAECLVELFGEHPAEQIVGAAGGIRHDHAHRLVRPFGRGAAWQQGENGEEGGNGRDRVAQGFLPEALLMAGTIAHGTGLRGDKAARACPHCAAFMPSTLAIPASCSFSSLMPAANSFGPRTSTIWPVDSSLVAMVGSLATAARTCAAICSRSASGMSRGPKMPPMLSITSAG